MVTDVSADKNYTMIPQTLDVIIEDHGSVVILQPVSEAGRSWLNTHLADGLRFTGDSVACEPRYVDDIARGMVRAGLAVTL